MKNYWYFVFGLLLLIVVILISGCINNNSPENNTWVNPEIECAIGFRETAIKYHPYQSGLTDEEKINPSGMLDFCSRMEKNFLDSNVSVDNADSVYNIVYKANIVRDESYGMPSPDWPKQPELTVEDLKKRVAIKKIGENEFEIFYSWIGCGTNYEYSLIKIKNIFVIYQMSDVQRIEAWRGSNPC